MAFIFINNVCRQESQIDQQQRCQLFRPWKRLAEKIAYKDLCGNNRHDKSKHEHRQHNFDALDFPYDRFVNFQHGKFPRLKSSGVGPVVIRKP